MPGPPRSRGCHRCRAKKVKCGEEKPECLRCQSGGTACPGYRPEKELVFLDMRGKVEQKIANTPRRLKVTRSEDGRSRTLSLKSSQSSSTSKAASATRTRAEIEDVSTDGAISLYRPPVKTDWDQQAMCKFLADFTIDSNDFSSSPGFLHNLGQLYLEASPRDELFNHASRALSLVSFSNQVGSEQLLVRARSSYGKSLGLVWKSLSQGHMLDDSTLIGIVLLNIYEMFSSDKPVKTVWETHADALGLLLRARGTSSQFTDPKMGGMARGAYRFVIFKNLLRRQAPGYETTLRERSMDPDTPWAQVMFALHRIARLLPVADAALSEARSVKLAGNDEDETSARLRDTLERLRAEDFRFVTWYGTQQTRIRAERMKVSGSSVDTHKNFMTTGFMDVYLAARIILLQTILDLAEQVQHYDEPIGLIPNMAQVTTQTEWNISIMVDDILASTHGVINQLERDALEGAEPSKGRGIAGSVCIFPLKIALGVKTLRDEQREAIMWQLSIIEKRLGLRQALQMKAL